MIKVSKKCFRICTAFGKSQDSDPLTMKGQNIGSSTKNFANKYLISVHLIVINENIGLLGHFKTMPIPLML